VVQASSLLGMPQAGSLHHKIAEPSAVWSGQSAA